MLDRDVLAREIAALFDYFGAQANEKHLDVFFKRFRHRGNQSFVAGCEQAKFGHPKKAPPTPNELDVFIEREAMRIASRLRQSEEYVAKNMFKSNKNDSTYVADKKTLVSPLIGKSEDLANAMFEFDARYPGRGWYEAACDVLTSCYVKSGLSEEEAKNLMPEKNYKRAV